MAHSARIVGAYELPAALDIAACCFAKRFLAKIGNTTVTITLPRLEWQDEKPRIVGPRVEPTIEQYLQRHVLDHKQGWEQYHFWGHVDSYHPEKCTILHAYLRAILLEFQCDPANITYSNYLYGRGHPQGTTVDGLFQDIDAWFEQICTWVEAAIDQEANPIHAVLEPTRQAKGLQVFTIEGTTLSIPATSFNMTVTLARFEPLSLTLLRKIIKLVNTGITPSDAHMLLRDSRAELRRGRYRRAVIDAGSATEITLADFNNRVTRVNTGTRGVTLGWYTQQSTIAAQANLPANITTDLVKVRNDAIHQNRIPTRDEAVLAVDLAKQVVDRLDPLPL